MSLFVLRLLFLYGLVAAMTLQVSVSVAQTVYRCDHQGKTLYSQQPCEQSNKSQPIDIKGSDIAAHHLNARLIWKTYPVKGQDYSGLIRSLAANGPQVNNKSFHGLANWRVSYQYDTKLVRQKCRFSSIVVNIDGEILMPHWTDEATAPQDLRQRWGRYYAALKAHEEGHIQHGKEFAMRVREQFLGLGDFDCGETSALARREFDRIYGLVKNRDRDYDQRTQHGATQGALF